MIVQSICLRALETPERLAISYGGKDYTYADFARRIAAARRRLGAIGLPRNGIAVVCVFDKLSAWVLRLALSSLGHTTSAMRVPDLASLAKPWGVSCAFVCASEWTGEAPEALRAMGVEFVVMPTGFDALDEDAAGAPADGAPEGGHIVLTSGTTGAPKGVLIDQTNEAAYVAQRLEAFSLTETSMVDLADWALWTSVGYSVALGVWSIGGAVAMHTAPLRLDILKDRRLTHAILTPTMLDQILATAPGVRLGRDDMRVYVGGSPMSKTLAAIAKAEITTQLFNIAASTEAGVWCVTPVDDPADVLTHQILPSRLVQIVDERDAALPAGEEGRVRVGCLPGVDRYLGDPDASAAFFRDGCFYSGDLGLLTENGRLKLQGRTTEIVTGATHKFPSGPIELALQERLGAAEVCVFSHPGVDGPEELHVFIQPIKPIAREALQELGNGYLELFPHVTFHVVGAIPRNERGKVLKDVLRRQVMAPEPTQPPTDQRNMATPT